MNRLDDFRALLGFQNFAYDLHFKKNCNLPSGFAIISVKIAVFYNQAIIIGISITGV